MATYAAGNETKRKIEEAARALFYKHGYNNTTYAQVAKTAGVNLGTIVYHFKSLDHLADLIYKDIVVQRKDVFLRKLDTFFEPGTFSRATTDIAQYRINTQTYADYPNYTRFISERMFISSTWNSPAFDYSLYNICRDYKLPITMNEYVLQKYLFLPYATIAISALNRGDIDLTVDEIFEYQIRIRLQSYGMKNEDIESILKDVKLIAEKVKLQVSDQMMFF
ncbi:MAG: TetR/AcrR family transcriptional regulator [Firmicutes bacterium]|nr:TetR/AcrR family transcriptional regulator [Bacillota bacterium]MBR0481723.1 TetR/AcrR family transcriptional regulator [Bacillota bacterium]